MHVDVFISHSSRNRAFAASLERALQDAGLEVWLDESEIELGVLLSKELQDSIRESRILLLLWSRWAAASRWVASEWLTAFHLNRFIVPCALDEAPLPQWLGGDVFLRARRVGPTVVDRLVRAVKEAPRTANPTAPLMRAEAPELSQAIGAIAAGQEEVGASLSRRNLPMAVETHAKVDGVMELALKTWPLDPMIVNLAGYQLKNAYMLRFWDAIQAGRSPDDPQLVLSERRFFETLAINPNDPSALNGLGSILMFRRDLDAAEFFIRTAIAVAKRQGIAYGAAKGDLALLKRFKTA